MRRSVLLLVVLAMASVSYAQVVRGLPVPIYGSSSSVIDRNGNLLVFDVVYSPSPLGAATAIPTVKTRVTVVTPDGTVKPPVEYSGTFQVLGAGWYGVYAIAYAYPTASTPVVVPGSSTATRHLMAFNVVAGVPLSPLPTIDVPTLANVELSPARDTTGPDLISVVDPVSYFGILAGIGGGPTLPAILRYAQIIKYAGGANFAAGARIPLP